MLFQPQLSTAEMPAVLDKFISITGIGEWKRRTTWLAQQIKQNHHLLGYIDQVHSLEVEFARVMHESSQAGQLDTRLATVERYRLFAFMATTTMVYERLTPRGQKRLRGMILGGLRDQGLTPLQQEMTVAAHLLSQKFDVTFSDMETGTGFDFLACRGDVKLEVECKRVGVSLGRKVPRLETLRLHQRIQGQVEPTLASLRCGLFLRVLLPDRLTAHVDQHKAIAAMVGAVFRTGVRREQPECRVDVHAFEIPGTPFEQPSDNALPNMRRYIEERFGVKNREMMILGNKTGTRALVVAIESTQRDAVLTRLFAELSECAKSQFSKQLLRR